MIYSLFLFGLFVARIAVPLFRLVSLLTILFAFVAATSDDGLRAKIHMGALFMPTHHFIQLIQLIYRDICNSF